MDLLQRLHAFFTRRRRGQQPPLQQGNSSMFHGVGTMTIIGGNFTLIVSGKCALARDSIAMDASQR